MRPKLMKALVKAQAGPGLALRDVPVPAPGAGEVLIRIRKTAICGTDVHIYNWDEWSRQTIRAPLTIGHEYVGVIEEIGAGVSGLSVGMLVSGEGHIVCGRCRNCLAGRRHLCPDTVGVGVNRDGAFAQYLCIPATNVWICDPAFPEELYAIFDPYGNAVHTALSFDVLGEDILITGAGPIGILACAVVRHAGARNVVITDRPIPTALELAGRWGHDRPNVAEAHFPTRWRPSFYEGRIDVALRCREAGPGVRGNDDRCNGGKIAPPWHSQRPKRS